jgi:hypothetical protein
MRIPSHVLAAGVLVAAVSASVWASEQAPVAPLPSRPMPQLLPGRTRQQLMQQAQAAAERYLQRYPAQPPKVICGMTLLRGPEGGCEHPRSPALNRRQPDDRKGLASSV